MASWVSKVLGSVVMFCINLYQYAVMPFFPPCCKFNLSCSEYTKIAITNCGVIKGIYLGVLRLLKCQPFFIMDKYKKYE